MRKATYTVVGICVVSWSFTFVAAGVLLYLVASICSIDVPSPVIPAPESTLPSISTALSTATPIPSPIPTLTPTPTSTLIPIPTSSPTSTPTPTFEEVVAMLDTPQKLEDYLYHHFEYKLHDGIISYPPEIFNSVKMGDCKDYATFASYVLAQHGYYAEIIVFSWHEEDGTQHGHTVVIFEDVDGTLKYLSVDRIVCEVESIEDVLEKEKALRHISCIRGYFVREPGTIYVGCPH